MLKKIFNKKNKENHEADTALEQVPNSNQLINNKDDEENEEDVVYVTILENDQALDQTKLYEITNPSIISRVASFIPTLFSSFAHQNQQKLLTDIREGKIVRIDQPFSNLSNSKSIEGAKRAITQDKNRHMRIKSQVNIEKIDITKRQKVTSQVSNMMHIGSFVVGQYYMNQVSHQLGKISSDIQSISNYQNIEFKSKVLSLLTSVTEISKFNYEIIEYDEKRTQKLILLEQLKNQATQVIGQVNLTIEHVIKDKSIKQYDKYLEKTRLLHEQINFQSYLNQTLEQISKLTYILSKGQTSLENAYYAYNQYKNQSIELNKNLIDWHQNQIEYFKIDLKQERVLRQGVKGMISKPLGYIDEKYKYQTISIEDISAIVNQSRPIENNTSQMIGDVFHQEVSLIIKDGKCYYLKSN